MWVPPLGEKSALGYTPSLKRANGTINMHSRGPTGPLKCKLRWYPHLLYYLLFSRAIDYSFPIVFLKFLKSNNSETGYRNAIFLNRLRRFLKVGTSPSNYIQVPPPPPTLGGFSQNGRPRFVDDFGLHLRSEQDSLASVFLCVCKITGLIW